MKFTSFESVGSAFKDLVKAHSTYLKSKKKGIFSKRFGHMAKRKA